MTNSEARTRQQAASNSEPGSHAPQAADWGQGTASDALGPHAANLALAAIRERLEAATEAWAWHESTDERVAGYGHHMAQMLYRLPRDGQTADMKASILALLAEVDRMTTALAAAEGRLDRVRELADEWTETYERWSANGHESTRTEIHRAHANRLLAALDEGPR